VVGLEARPPNVEGKGQVTVRDLLRNALRMRPDRIIVGEVRGGEALDMLQAMNTGHEGSLSTAHANSARHLLWRLETMALMSDVDLPVAHVREQVASAIDVVVHMSRLRDGRRVVQDVATVEGLANGEPAVRDVYRFEPRAGRGASGRFVATGGVPTLARVLADRGCAVMPELSGTGDDSPEDADFVAERP
jgi:pilus assembly protein CpaF